ncbi:MAG: TMEM165/GDT1 family protein [Nocardioides sp.]|nr:TMEM165/GDT1 family protein [Nocardioides sp.]
MDLLVAAVTFGTIFVVELPDKTFIATLVLATRYRPLLVWIGVGLAFAVQTGIAVALGGVASLLPTHLVQTVAMLLFLGGAVLLLKEAREARGVTDPTEGSEEYAARARDVTGYRVIGASFLVLFAAEWGDLSQLLTISLVARYDAPLSVFVGALLALLAVSGLAVLVGRALLARVRLPVLYTAGAVVCLGLASFTAYELFVAA